VILQRHLLAGFANSRMDDDEHVCIGISLHLVIVTAAPDLVVMIRE
jgi:hypothetical protein